MLGHTTISLTLDRRLSANMATVLGSRRSRKGECGGLEIRQPASQAVPILAIFCI
jgi:hypothetical protein